MRWLRVIQRLIRRNRFARDIDDELAFHLEMREQELIEQGLSPKQARREARLRFGNGVLAKEDSRAVWSAIWLETFWRDLTYGVRTLRRSPGFTAVAGLSLAIGIGATTTVFSVIEAMILRPLPYYEPERLITAFTDDGNGWRYPVTAEISRRWREQSKLLEGLALPAMQPYEYTVPIGGAGRSLKIQRVDRETFRILGGQPTLGRGFLPHDEHKTVALISHRLWQEHFGGDPNVLNLLLAPGWEGEAAGAQIIGIMPPDFSVRIWPWHWGELDPRRTDVWLLFDADRDTAKSRRYAAIARLKPGVTIEQARAEFDAIAARTDHELPELNHRGRSRVVESLANHISQGHPGFSHSNLYLFWGAAAFVLLIGCGNVASLLLSRGFAREREMANRAALGAGRTRLAMQLLTESTLIALTGGLFGTVLAFGGVRLFVKVAPHGFGFGPEIRVDPYALVFTFGIALAVGVAVGLVPALRASRPNIANTLKAGGRLATTESRQRVRNTMVVGEVAIAVTLLAGAGLMINSLVRLLRLDPGFNPRSALTVGFVLQGPKYRRVERSGDRIVATRITPAADAFYEALLERVRALPGVVSASLSHLLPTTNYHRKPYTIPGHAPLHDEKETYAAFLQISPSYFQNLEIPLLKGRFFSDKDTAASPWVAIISRQMAADVFPDVEPLGKFLQVKIRDYELGSDVPERPRQIVGVVGDVRSEEDKKQPPVKTIYVPYSQILRTWPGAESEWIPFQKYLIVRTESDPTRYIPAVRQVFAQLDQEQVFYESMTLDHALRGTTKNERFWVQVLGIAAAPALFLAAVGLYGVISYSVARRTQEFGIRMALGAERLNVLKVVLGDGLRLSLIGVGIGIVAALGLSRLIESQLYGVTPTDPLTFTAVAAVLLAVALLACYLPARRATRVDPIQALRYE